MLRTTAFLLTTILCVTVSQAAQVRAPDPSQGDGRVSGFYTWQAAIPKPGQLLRQEQLEPTLGLANAAAQLRFLNSSTDGVDGKSPTVVSGLLFIPKGEPPAGGWPLMAWAHETAWDGRHLCPIVGRLLDKDRGVPGHLARARHGCRGDRLPRARDAGASSVYGCSTGRV